MKDENGKKFQEEIYLMERVTSILVPNSFTKEGDFTICTIKPTVFPHALLNIKALWQVSSSSRKSLNSFTEEAHYVS